MGLPGGLLRRVFSKSRSTECNESSSKCAQSKVKWVRSVRSYLCGSEMNSKLIQKELEEQELQDSVSNKSSENNLTKKHNLETDSSNNAVRIESHEDRNQEHTEMQLMREEEAATAIQSAYRGYVVRRHFKEIRKVDQEQEHREEQEEEEEEVNSDLYENTDAATVATSTEVQLGESFSTLKFSEESVSLHSRGASKGRPPVFRVKEEWDDSTVSTNISKMRMQNRLEATTRRERALAYAFSQQLRTCNSKKRSSRCDSNEPNVSWSWLERWMATRTNTECDNQQPDDCISKNMEELYATTSTSRKTILIKNRRLDVSFEGIESCGSNDVSVNFEGFSAKSESSAVSERNKIVRNKPKAASRSAPRRKVLSESRCNSRSNKVIKKEHHTQGKCNNPEEAKDFNTPQPSSEI